MTAHDDDILDDVFHGVALAAFLDQAEAGQGWPDSEATRRRAYRYYEDALAEKNRRKSAAALDSPGIMYRTIQTPETEAADDR